MRHVFNVVALLVAVAGVGAFAFGLAEADAQRERKIEALSECLEHHDLPTCQCWVRAKCEVQKRGKLPAIKRGDAGG